MQTIAHLNKTLISLRGEESLIKNLKKNNKVYKHKTKRNGTKRKKKDNSKQQRSKRRNEIQ